MRSQHWLLPILALLGALALGGCGANPPAQAEPAAQGGIVLPTPPPMPTARPRAPTPTPPPAPAAGAPAANTALFAADFAPGSNLQQWTVVDGAEPLEGPSAWAIKDGRLQQIGDANGTPGQYPSAILTGDPSWRDYSASVAAYNVSNDQMGVVARAGKQGYYVFRLLPAAQPSGMLLARYDTSDGSYTTLATANGGGFEPRRWYELRLQVQGDHLTAYVDGQLALETHDATLTQGRAGVEGFAMGGLEFDNFTVQTLTGGN